jgi:REP element-mobilizing transposase RayT
MTRPRSHIVPPDLAGTYHCVQRCVRRAFLCGRDEYSGQSYEHRKAWIETRIRLVAECFAVEIHAYAIMSNHLHLVLGIDLPAVSAWGDEDVAARWVRLFPPRENSEAAVEQKRMRLLSDPPRLDLIRQRLGSLSWLMRCLVEPIARRANREDGCKGRFWEGRYKCQALCDARSVLAAMAYVDLNPIRAGMTDQLHTSAHTSAAARIKTAQANPQSLTRPMRPVVGGLRTSFDLSTADYLQLLDWTSRAYARDKRGRIPEDAPAIVAAIDRDARRWATRVAAFGGGWARAAGSARDLLALAERLGQRWLKGIRLAIRLS